MRGTLPTIALSMLALAPAASAAPVAQTAAADQAEAALEQAEELREGDGVRTGRELTDALRELAVGLRHLRGEERERAVELLARPSTGGSDPIEALSGPLLPPTCNARFCVHAVSSGIDTPPPGTVDLVLQEAERVYAFHNVQLGWRQPPGDGDLGAVAAAPESFGGKIDIYLKDLGSQRLFGYAATDPGQGTKAQYSHLVIDDDFDPAQFGAPALELLKITLAHEYAHVLQYGYDVMGDGWHYEASATWFEHRMHPNLKDWHRFLADRSGGRGWRSLTALPLTAFDHPADQPRNAKPYGSVVWNHFLSRRYGARGDELQRLTWERSNGISQPSTWAHELAIRAVGGSGLATDFGAFAAALAEWRVPGAFPDAAELPDVERAGSLAVDGQPIAPAMDHLTFALYDVPATAAPRIRLAASFPAGMRAALALVGRPGPDGSGPLTIRVADLPQGGAGAVTLARPDTFAGGGRITAVLVNADAGQTGYSNTRGDWLWTRDSQRVLARVSADASRPELSSRLPARAARGVRTKARVRVTFSTGVSGVNARSFTLHRPNGRRVPASVRYDPATRAAVLVPRAELPDTTRFTVRLADTIADSAGVPLAPTQWRFTTVRRPPRVALRASLAPGAARLRLRSRDRDRLTWLAALRSGGRTLARRRGALKPGGRRAIGLRAAGARRARLVVVLRDPQGNRKRLTRALRLRP